MTLQELRNHHDRLVAAAYDSTEMNVEYSVEGKNLFLRFTEAIENAAPCEDGATFRSVNLDEDRVYVDEPGKR